MHPHKNQWFVVPKAESWLVVQSPEEESPKWVTVSESSDAASRTSSSCGEDTRIENRDSIIFSPEIEPPVNHEQCLEMTLSSGPRQSSWNLLGEYPDATRALLGDPEILLRGISKLYHNDGDQKSKIIYEVEAASEKMQLLNSEDDFSEFFAKQFEKESETKSKTCLNSIDNLKSCVEQLRAINNQKNTKNVTISSRQFLVSSSVLLVSSVLLFSWLGTRKRDDIRRWFRSSPEISLFGLSLAVDRVPIMISMWAARIGPRTYPLS